MTGFIELRLTSHVIKDKEEQQPMKLQPTKQVNVTLCKMIEIWTM